MQDDKNKTLMLVLILALLFVFSGGGTIGKPPPFKTDKLTVLVVEESSPDQSETPVWVNSTKDGGVRAYVEKRAGEESFRLIDQSNPSDLVLQKWKDAFAVKRDSVPWIVAAGPKSGINQALPKTAEETIKLLEGVK